LSVVTPSVESSDGTADQRTRAVAKARWLVLACYLLAAVLLTWRLWADPASRVQVGDLGDLDQFSWFLRYSATAVSHGHLPALVTTTLNAPHDVNLLWNTSFLLPGMVLTPVTLLAGPQVSLTVALTLGFAGSAASLFFVLRRWGASISAAALGGAVYGFSPAMVDSGIGHYHMQFAVLPPLIIDALLRIVTGRSCRVRTGIWLGVLIGAQLFIGAEVLVETGVAAGLLLVVLAASRPQLVREQARAAAAALAAAAGVALLICGRALWVQFHGPSIKANHTALVHYRGHLYALVTPSSAMLLHTSGTAAAANRYPEPQAEYLAYLGVPLLLVLIAAAIFFWRHPRIRATAVTFVALEVFALGGTTQQFHGFRYPGFLLPWFWLEHLPFLDSLQPGRLSLAADGAAAALLAFSLDLARSRMSGGTAWRGQGWLATAVAVVAILPLIPLPYQATDAARLPPGWQATFTRLHLAPDAHVLVVPVAYSSLTQPMRWQADTGEPGSMIGGDFIAADGHGGTLKGGLAGQKPTTRYLDALWARSATAVPPARARIRADLESWKPAAVVAVTSPGSRLEGFLTGLFGRPTSRIGSVISWRL
jgi:hypothetical protein